jgi:hypothetical protein
MNARGAMLTVLAAASLVAGCAPETGFDLVIEGGRVMDPESGLDGVRNVGTARWPPRTFAAHPLTLASPHWPSSLFDYQRRRMALDRGHSPPACRFCRPSFDSDAGGR